MTRPQLEPPSLSPCLLQSAQSHPHFTRPVALVPRVPRHSCLFAPTAQPLSNPWAYSTPPPSSPPKPAGRLASCPTLPTHPLMQCITSRFCLRRHHAAIQAQFPPVCTLPLHRTQPAPHLFLLGFSVPSRMRHALPSVFFLLVATAGTMAAAPHSPVARAVPPILSGPDTLPPLAFNPYRHQHSAGACLLLLGSSLLTCFRLVNIQT